MTTRGLTLGSLAAIGAAVITFAAVRLVLGDTSSPVKGEPPLLAEVQETASPIPSPSDTAGAIPDQGPFTGTLAGISIVDDVDATFSTKGVACFAELQGKGGGTEEFFGLELPEVAVGTVMEISPRYLPPDFPDPTTIDPDSTFFIPSWAAVCGGAVYEVVRTFHPGHAQLNIHKWYDTAKYAPVPYATADRFEVITVGGQDAVHIKKLPDAPPVAEERIIVRKPYGIIEVIGSNLSLDEVIRVVEGID